MKQVLVCLVLLMLAAGCSLGATAAPTPTLAPTPTDTLVPTVTPIPPPTDTPGPTATPTTTPTLTPTPFSPFNASATVDNLNVRANPGYLFASLFMVKQNTVFSVLGKCPGGDWIYVKNAAGQTGWVYAVLLKGDHDLTAVPVVEPGNVQVVRGHLVDTQGNPVNGVQFTLLKGSATGAPRNDAITDANGDFYAFMPADSAGTWSVAYSAISCSSNVMDANCQCKNAICGSVYPSRIDVTLPTNEVLAFTWQ